MSFCRALWLAAALVAHVSVAVAQDAEGPTPEEVAEARARYVSGNRAAQEGRWADAAVDFERAYALTGAPPALFNQAVALRGLGRYADARRALDLLLAQHRSALEGGMLQEALRIRDEVAARTSTLELTGLRDDATYDVRLDGEPLEDGGERPWQVETDPGVHHLTVQREGFETFTWDGRLVSGEVERVRVVQEPTAGILTPPPADVAPEEGGVMSSPVFWVVATAVVLAGGATGAYFYLNRDQGLAPQSDMAVTVP